MKKILIVTTGFYPYIGGLEKYIEESGSRLVKLGNQVDVLAIKYGDSLEYETYKGINVYRIKSLFSIGSNWVVPDLFKWFKVIRSIHKKNNYDYVMTHTRFFLTSYLGALFAKHNKIKYIHVEHGADSVIHRNKIIEYGALLFDKVFGKYVMKSADLIIAISNAGADFCKAIGAKNIVVIPNGIDTNFWKPYQGVNLKDNNLKSILFVGRIVVEKGIFDLLEAYRQIKDEAKLVYIGDGESLSKLKGKVSEYGLAEMVEVVGRKSPEEVRNFLSKTDVFVNPSFNEGLPTVVLEALSMGVPVVATDVGGTRDIQKIVGDDLALVMVNDIQSITTNLHQVLLKKRTSIIADETHKKISQFYGWDSIVNDINKVINEG